MTGCPSGKIPYPSPQAAHHAIQGIRRRQTGRKKTISGRRKLTGSAYRCPSCPAWHVTSSPRG